MSNHTTDITALLERWFVQGDEAALRHAYQELSDRLVATPEALKVLGGGAIDEIRQDVLIRMLDQEHGSLRDVQYPIAYIKIAWRRELVSALRKWGLRHAKEGDVSHYTDNLLEHAAQMRVDDQIDATRAIEIASRLTSRGRLAVLLTTRPDRITDADWESLVESLPPPPPPRPREALDREEASLLLYPPEGEEDAKQRHQRLNSFDKAFTRAVAKIRELMEVDP